MKLEAYCIPEICNKCWKIIDKEKFRGTAMWQTCMVLTSEEKCCAPPTHFWSLFRSQGEICEDSSRIIEETSVDLDSEDCEFIQSPGNGLVGILEFEDMEDESSPKINVNAKSCLLTKTVICGPKENLSIFVLQIMALVGLVTATVFIMVFIVHKMRAQKQALKESHSARMFYSNSPSVLSNYGLTDALLLNQEETSKASSKLLSPNPSIDQRTFPADKSHIESDGFVDPRIQVSKTAFDLGIIAAAPIKEDEVLIRIPKSCQINLHSFDSSPNSMANFIRQKKITLSCHQILALHLALERRKPLTPIMKKFIQTLPEHFSLPLDYSPKAMANLPCEVYLLSVALQKNVTELCFALGKQIGLTKADLTWAYSMVLSRTFSLPNYMETSDLDYCSDKDTSRSAFMCPFMDLINHSSTPNCYYETAKCFKETMNKKLESWRKFETAKGFVYALYEDKLCDGFQNTISVLSFLLKKSEEKVLEKLVEMKLRSNEKFITEDNEDIYKVENFILNSWKSKIQ
ncbi:Oidioi.mRNA.OKI2018_I69.chr1.g1295.t1.cds [Oikopleura dioica]|uniref:Oidioi.mRNA.OKI2018_I69.chr1.g1295.t1.cds n=1 Tax=Oikopleura dioica TaxID=34765 RepID=A0ABN7SRP9_OIKDI|nr:Oidioi.mRNA.OKI2018_I69.chr1.g1295.t1.cds [Oikopleura dioica]